MRTPDLSRVSAHFSCHTMTLKWNSEIDHRDRNPNTHATITVQSVFAEARTRSKIAHCCSNFTQFCTPAAAHICAA